MCPGHIAPYRAETFDVSFEETAALAVAFPYSHSYSYPRRNLTRRTVHFGRTLTVPKTTAACRFITTAPASPPPPPFDRTLSRTLTNHTSPTIHRPTSWRTRTRTRSPSPSIHRFASLAAIFTFVQNKGHAAARFGGSRSCLDMQPNDGRRAQTGIFIDMYKYKF